MISRSSFRIARRRIGASRVGTVLPAPDTSKTLKASTFNLPNQPQTPAPQHELVPQEDIDDFNLTKLIHGTTDLQLAITSRASNKLNSIAETDNNPNTALKISVESGGCHGFQYNLNLTDLEKEIAADADEELLVFKREDGTGQVAQVVLDESSLEILQDSKIDYTKELIGSSFKVVDSPYTSTACGCGASFDFDFEKLQRKKEAKEAN
ncbi:uncharacterized protein CANTADRAFT_90440 [Suhomyces tanzawaensis NRRL Y-17324]|uniref:Core domain-containing protein n=1 Tax=Suhomyces tanzawaensis NRRL Y-17324 TaxID=984487 RepID=A0A1E4SIM5_9ASCO|nr:uncharacterized protein CANTADRAFT_90440 [Suhomyces tanzawaensis NRRL Y-17324]ODV79354.1 hypothetical protein CANTADRAFT_90440 [Suhomyces tanzawaensis NRRL Y-17324]